MAVEAGVHDPADLGGVLFDVAPELRVQWAVAGRHAVVRSALEDGQVRGSLGDHRGGLDAGRPGPDQPDPLAAEIDAFMRPSPVWTQRP